MNVLAGEGIKMICRNAGEGLAMQGGPGSSVGERRFLVLYEHFQKTYITS
jgi:hypothetical protein